ncbi:MAG: hypothetical protein V5786_03555 [Psychromonas sp.]
MKKVILAVIIPSLLATSSAFAGGIYLLKNDQMSVNMNGDIDLTIINKDKAGDSATTIHSLLMR